MPIDSQMLMWVIPAFLAGLVLGWVVAGSARRTLGAMREQLESAEAARHAAEAARLKAERDAASARDQLAPLADEVDRLRRATAARKSSAAPVETAAQAEGAATGQAAAFAPGEKLPLFMDAPRGKADDFGVLKGVGPKLQAKFNEIGIFHLHQIANWTTDDIALVDAKLDAFKGRIVRDQLVDQARLLVAGRITEYEARFGKIGGGDA